MTIDTDGFRRGLKRAWEAASKAVDALLQSEENCDGRYPTVSVTAAWIQRAISAEIEAAVPGAPTPSASVESADAGEDDATFLDRMCTHPPVNALSPRELDDIDRLIALARRALTPPSTSTAASGTDDGWRPIKTAPKDGRDSEGRLPQVLLIARYPDRNIWSDIYHGWWCEDHWSRWPHQFPPTHWRPLPPPFAIPAPSAMSGPAVSEAEAYDAVFEALKLALACEPNDWHIWTEDARKAVQALVDLRTAAARVRAPEPVRHDDEEPYRLKRDVCDCGHAPELCDAPGCEKYPHEDRTPAEHEEIIASRVRHDDAKNEAVAPGLREALKVVRILQTSWRKDATETSDPGGRRWNYTEASERIESQIERLLRDANRLATANPILPAPEPSAGMARAVKIVEGIQKDWPTEFEGGGDYMNGAMVMLDEILAALRADTR